MEKGILYSRGKALTMRCISFRSFYNEYAACDIRKKHENRADKRAIELRLSADDLDQAVADGHTDLWDLAEHFGVTEEFMRKAVCWYTHGNLATELYF